MLQSTLTLTAAVGTHLHCSFFYPRADMEPSVQIYSYWGS